MTWTKMPCGTHDHYTETYETVPGPVTMAVHLEDKNLIYTVLVGGIDNNDTSDLIGVWRPSKVWGREIPWGSPLSCRTRAEQEMEDVAMALHAKWKESRVENGE